MNVLCVLQFYHRHNNMVDMLSRICLESRISEVVVLDNNPDVAAILLPAESRFEKVSYIKSLMPKVCMHRLEFLYNMGADYLNKFDRILIIDDDVILDRMQVSTLLDACKDLPREVGVGVCGEDIVDRGDGRKLELRYSYIDDKVDVLNQVYALTPYHILELLPNNLISVIGKVSFSELHIDDIASTFSKSHKNVVKKLGYIKTCPTYCAPGIAVHKASTFNVARKAFIDRLPL